MITRRRNWLYRLSGQRFVHSVSFKRPITAAQVKAFLQHSVGVPLELWGRSNDDVLNYGAR